MLSSSRNISAFFCYRVLSTRQCLTGTFCMEWIFKNHIIIHRKFGFSPVAFLQCYLQMLVFKWIAQRPSEDSFSWKGGTCNVMACDVPSPGGCLSILCPYQQFLSVKQPESRSRTKWVLTFAWTDSLQVAPRMPHLLFPY